MESSISNSEEGELQQMQLEESELHQKCLAWFKKLKIHLRNLHRFSEVINIRLFEIAFRIFFREKHQTFIDNMYHNLNQLQWQLERHNFHGHDSKTCFEVLRTLLKKIDSKEVNALDFHNKSWQKDFKDYRNGNLKLIDLSYSEREVQAIKEIEKWLNEKEIQQQGSLVTEGITLDATLVTEGISLDASLVTEAITLDASLVIEGISLDAGLVAKQSTVDSVSSTSSEQQNECNSLRNECIISWNENRSSDNERSNSGNYANAYIVPSYESDTMSEIELLNEEISNLKSQACKKDKAIARENEKFDEYVQPLLKSENKLENKNQDFLKQINDLDNRLLKVRQTDQTLRMLLPKEHNINTGKQGFGFENQNDDVNPSLLNKAKELAPRLYNIDEMGKDELSDHKIISEKELKCEAEKR
ncbi:hypothetical protein Tco_0701667 [Tanacetum coccineum]